MFFKTKIVHLTGILFIIQLTVDSIILVNANPRPNPDARQQRQHQRQQHQRQQHEIDDQTGEETLTDSYKIENSDQGLQKVNLKCGSNSMHVVLETEKPFTGVMYTKGSFYDQTAPCFVKPTGNGNVKSLEMNFHLDQCQTVKDGELFSNVVVIQNDPELITPGDSAFSLECDFRNARSLDVGADMQTRDSKPQKLRGSSRQRQ